MAGLGLRHGVSDVQQRLAGRQTVNPTPRTPTPSTWASEVDTLARNLATVQRALGAAAHEVQQLQGTYERLLQLATGERPWGHADGGSPVYRLTLQERRVAILVGLGKQDREVAQLLRLSVHTVKSHVKNILRKLGLRSRWQLPAVVTRADFGLAEFATARATSLGE